MTIQTIAAAGVALSAMRLALPRVAAGIRALVPIVEAWKELLRAMRKQ